MSTKTKILEPPRKTEVQKTATTQGVEPIVKKEHAAVATESLGKELASKPVIDVEKGNDPNIIVPKQTPEEIAQRNVSEFRKWYEQDGLTDEEREKRDKARAAQTVLSAVGDGLSSIANLHYTTQYAPNIEFTSGIEQLRNRWDKEDAERKAKYREQLSLYQQMQAAKRAEDELKRRKEREKIADERYEEEKKYRAKKDAEAAATQQRAEQWAKEKFNIELEADNKRHAATLKNQRVIEGMRQQEATDKNSIPIFLSETEEVRIPKSIWNNKDRIAEVYEALPAELKQQAVERYATKQGKEYDSEKKEMVTTYKPMTWQQMQQAIGAFLADSDAVAAQNLVRRMAGQEVVQSTKDEEIVDYTPKTIFGLSPEVTEAIDYTPKGINGQNEHNEITEVIDYTPKASAKQNGEPIVIQPTPKVSTWNPAKAQINAQKAKEGNDKRVKAASRLNILERNK